MVAAKDGEGTADGETRESDGEKDDGELHVLALGSGDNTGEFADVMMIA